jgi:uncharacterized protein with ParB-like and HNH nuclease domain/predicted transport protein
MKASESKLLPFLRKSRQFVIPIFQRTYSWTGKECRQLWDDVIRAGESDSIDAHFVGSIVYIEQSLYQASSQSPLLVIDGQQRLTTVTLLLAALARTLETFPPDQQEVVDGFSPRKLRNWYLVDPEEVGDRHHKLLLSQADKDTLIAIIGDRAMPDNPSRNIIANYRDFTRWLAEYKENIGVVCSGLAKLLIVDVALTRGQDNPQLIFESMNSTGRELSQSDLIRNFVLMGLEPELQTRLYQDYWRPMEVSFGHDNYDAHFDGFIRHYLTLKTGEIPRKSDVYEAFRAHSRSADVERNGIEELVREIREFARYYCAMALGTERNPELRDAFSDLRELVVDPAYPFLLDLYHDFARGVLSQPAFVQAVRLVESFVFRRAVCGLPTNALNQIFASFPKVVQKDRYVESIEARLLLLSSNSRFPRDAEFQEAFTRRDLYNFPRRSYWLRRIENFRRKERALESYTVEHILPQNPELPEAWRTALGPDWRTIQEKYLHTLGNLTLTGYNSEYRDRPFAQKRDIDGGFRESPLRLNQGLGQIDVWNEDAIRNRANHLARVALDVWPFPTMTEEVLDSLRPRVGKRAVYRIEDHPKLTSGMNWETYNAFRQEVMELIPGVTEVVRKNYIAYKAEANFVYLWPLARRLWIKLPIPLEEIDDPRNLCVDDSRMDNGVRAVGFRLTEVDQVPYAIGLVRQVLARQLPPPEPPM